MDWFKPNGKAIVTFNIEKLTGVGKNWALIRKQRGTTLIVQNSPYFLPRSRIHVRTIQGKVWGEGENGE